MVRPPQAPGRQPRNTSINLLGLHRVTLAVDDSLARLHAHRAAPSEVAQYEDSYRLCCVRNRGPADDGQRDGGCSIAPPR